MNQSADGLYRAAKAAVLDKSYEFAYNQLLAALRADPQFHPAYFLLSRIAYDFQNVDKEVETLQKAVQLAPNNVDYLAHLARAYAVKGNVEKALETIEKAQSLANQTALSLDTLGSACNRLSLYQRAAGFFERAIELEQHNPAIYFNLASTLKFCGRFEESRGAYERAIEINPHYYKAHAALTSLGGISESNNHIERLRDLLPDIRNPEEKLHIAHALSKELEAVGQYDQSFEFLAAAKNEKLSQWNYSLDDDLAVFEALQKQFHHHNLTQAENNPAGPIFVVGMPRSGTTLVERLISNHSEVATAGELPNFALIVNSLLGKKSSRLIDVDTVSQTAKLDFGKLGKNYLASTRHHYGSKKYLVDKLPLNVLYAGHIACALPHAKIICLDRDFRDTAMSNFRQLFSFQDYTYGYSLTLETCLRYTRAFQSLKDFWRSTFPEQFYVVNYEALVSNPTEEARKLFEFCGLAFEPDVLHIEDNKNPVATASSVQVRKPISDKSIGQWKNYQTQMDDALQNQAL